MSGYYYLNGLGFFRYVDGSAVDSADDINFNTPYYYTDEKGIDELYSVSCHIYKDCCTIDYTISEDEGLIFFCGFILNRFNRKLFKLLGKRKE